MVVPQFNAQHQHDWRLVGDPIVINNTMRRLLSIPLLGMSNNPTVFILKGAGEEDANSADGPNL